MTDKAAPPNDPGASEAVDALLREGLQTAPLNPDALERLRAAAYREWRGSLEPPPSARPRARHLRRLAWVGAAGIAAAILVVLLIRPTGEAAVIGSLSRLGSDENAARATLLGRRPPQPGDLLRVGEELSTGGPVLVSLLGGGTLRIAPGTLLRATGRDEVFLAHGRVYADKPPGLASRAALKIRTRAGVVEHVGTEFEVLSNDQAVRVRVREGSVRLLAAGGAVIATAGTELVVSPGGSVARNPVASYGEEWAWVMSLAPEFAIEGRSLMDFLQWVCRELGLHLEFADPRAERIAADTVLHGSIQGSKPIEALANVLATTSLTYETQGGAVRVHSTP